jgi:hypothetical protein
LRGGGLLGKAYVVIHERKSAKGRREELGIEPNGLAAAARPKLLGEQRGPWKLFRVTDP